MGSRKPRAWPVLVLCSFFIVWVTLGQLVEGLGVNWGTQASHPLHPTTVVRLLKANNINKVKLFDSDNNVLRALAGSGIDVTVGIPNNLLQTLTDPAQATSWVQNNVVRYLFQGGTSIKYVAVGNEPFLTSYNGSFLTTTVPALKNIQSALNAANVGDQIKATVPMNADVLQSTEDVPSSTTFRPDIQDLMDQIVDFLAQNDCPFTINIYPFISVYNDKHFPLAYAFFDGTTSPVQDAPYTYQNVFDASYDSLVVALSKAGHSNMSIIVGEIGWPTDGDVNANLNLAQKFNQGYLTHVLSNVGTPRRPNTAIDFYLFSLIDEDQKSIAPGNFERHWGIFRYDGRPKYSLSLSGSNGQTLVQASGVQYLTQQWCVLSQTANDKSSLPDSITYACTNSDCTSLGYGCSCNPYLDANGNASYAFNQYFQMKNQDLGTCNFNGLGQVVAKNPSVNNCEFIVQISETSAGTCNSCKWTTTLISAVMVMIPFLL